MAERRMGSGRWIALGLGISALAAAGFLLVTKSRSKQGELDPRAQAHSAKVSPSSSLSDLADGVRRGDGMALAVIRERLTTEPGTPLEPIVDTEAEAWVGTLDGLRTGYLRFSPYGRASAVMIGRRILDRYAVEPCPRDWAAAITPAFELLTAALSDPEAGVRAQALREIGALWSWSPGCDLFTGDLDHLAAWKEAFLAHATRALGDSDETVRGSAVSALASLPLDAKAAPALAYLHDPSPSVRLQVLSGFASRDALLDAEAILPLLYDSDPTIAASAEHVLEKRGLNATQIGLGKLVVHPQERMRSSTFEMLDGRDDIDPTLWLIYLSRDKAESIRARAIEVLARTDRPEARARLAEMAATDPAPGIREAAAKVATSDPQTTAALPPLPGSPSLNPRAN